MGLFAHHSSPWQSVNAINQAISGSTCSGRKGVGRRLQTLRDGSGRWNACHSLQESLNMEFIYRYSFDNYGFPYPVTMFFHLLSLIPLALFCCRKIEAIGLLMVWMLFGNFISSEENHQNISTFGTEEQKATLKRCIPEYTLTELTPEYIKDVMTHCREADEKRRDSIYRE
ncbi:hypothetical protein [Neisseria sp.]|uniref:hypothetical protein n=1 Tax=Neisseria sp. TaxID=192066 RepID=UPI0035A0E3A5